LLYLANTDDRAKVECISAESVVGAVNIYVEQNGHSLTIGEGKGLHLALTFNGGSLANERTSAESTK